MAEDTKEINLSLLEANSEVLVKKEASDSYFVSYIDRHWRLWPLRRCWVECNNNGDVTGVMHYGSPASFNDKEISKNSKFPKNHLKKWESAELDLLATLVSLNASVTVLAKSLQRTEWSVTARIASEHGLNLDHLTHDPKLGSLRASDLLPNLPD